MGLSKKKLGHFKEKLMKLKEDILNSDLMKNLDDLKISQEDLADEADLANQAINQQVTFRMREREVAKLKRINAALERIEEGTYGFCVESGDEIEEKRLENQPWTEYCLEVAEELERAESQTFRRRA